jgi:hypothetical protein
VASSRVTVPIHGTTDFRAPLPDDAGKGISSLPGTVLANPNSQRLLGHIPGGQSHELRHGLEIASTEVETVQFNDHTSAQPPGFGSALRYGYFASSQARPDLVRRLTGDLQGARSAAGS